VKLKSYRGWCVICSLAIAIVTLSLVDAGALVSFYLFVGKLLFIDPHIVAKHFEQISNYGHTLAAFILTLLTLPLLKRPLLIAIPALTIFVVCGEGLQYFSRRRFPPKRLPKTFMLDECNSNEDTFFTACKDSQKPILR